MASIDKPVDYQSPNVFSMIPEELDSAKVVISVASQVKSVRIPSTTPSIGPGGSMYVNINPSPNGLLRPGSAYLEFDLAVNGPAPGQGGNTGAGAISFNTPLQSACALMNKVLVYCGGQNSTVLMNASFATEMVILTKCATSWINSVFNAMTNGVSNNSIGIGTSNAYFGTGSNSSGSLSVGHYTVPILAGILNSQQGLPLFLLNSNTQIQVDFEAAIAKVFYSSGYNASYLPTGYTITNIFLVYEQVEISPDFCNMVRQSLKDGGCFQMSCLENKTQIQGIANGSSTVLFPLGLQSLRASLYTFLPNTFSQTTRNVFSSQAQTQMNTYLNGGSFLVNTIGSMDVTTRATIVFQEARKAVWSNLDPVGSYGCDMTVGNFPLCNNNASNPYLLSYFVGGNNLACWKQGTGIYSGSSCMGQLKSEFTIGGGSSVNFLQLIQFDQLLQFYDGGIVKIIQ